MLEAGKEELELARLAGDRSPDGKYWIRVIADGMWSKRSYGNKYDAKSGVAFIIGARTGKILFYGVRNKHCYVCTLDHNKKKPVREHTCAKNFNGPSGQMEASIIMEGFKASLEMHGVRFLQLVGDRDSTVHKTLVEEAPYGLGFTVEKIDCKNHLLRNYRTWCLQLGANTNFPIPEGVDAKDTKQKQFWIKELRILRTLIKNKTKRLSNAISKASTYRARQEGTLHVRIQQLSDDIKNSACHVFGEHSRCQAYFCQTARNRAQAGPSAPPAAPAAPAAAQSQEEAAPDEAVLNWVPRLQKSGLWTKLMSNLDTMANRANSLIENVNNNMCEVANSVVAKFIAGKRVFYSSRASFNVRCAAATLAMNTSGDFRRIVHKKLQNGQSPGKFTATHSALKAKRLMQQRERRTKVRAAGPPPRRVFDAAGHNAYGLEARAPGDRDESVDDPPAAKPQQPLPEDPRLPAKMQEVTDRLQADLRHLQEISSYPQGGHKWLGARKIRITASNFGPVVRRSKGHSCKVLVRTMLHSKKNPTPAMRHGNDMEASARRYFEQKYGRTVNQTGLVVDRQLPFLAASPDGLIGDDELLEIKCPTSGVDFSSAEEAVAGDKVHTLRNKGSKKTKLF
ncbi:uncharacterized protein LOC127748927 [Frankliniella occidentalis]|uniref:Uncharacterized protein LOC127748927 n=1 Tax=Frankliniella occidentalis TaxID=133901 RepID=A0A9C6WWB0_FRAOC|nr:uncharacterized protein LOC127748927 [Frankliniella occidentalis]